MKYISNNNYVLNDICGEKVLVPIVNSVAQMDFIYTLNSTGAFILEHITEATDTETIVDMLLENFETDRTTAEADVSEFLNEMVAKGYVRTA